MLLYDCARRYIKTDDYNKLPYWFAMRLLSTIQLWPSSKSYLRKSVVLIFYLLVLALVCVGLINFIFQHIQDFNNATYAMCILMLPMMAFFKISFLWYQSKRLNILIKDVMTNFWPYDLTDGPSKADIITNFKYSNIFMVPFFSLGFSYVTIFFCIPVINNKRTLPFDAEFSFDWTASPIYELIYIANIIALYLMAFSIAGSDCLLLAVLLSTSGQYSILEDCFYMFNTNKMAEINTKLREIYKDDLHGKYDELKEYFIRCTRQHQTLLNFTKNMQEIFNPSELSKLAFSVITLCLGILRFTVMEESTLPDLIISLMFVLGVTLQLAIDCFLGSILHYQASLLPNSIYDSNWVNLSDNQLKRDVLFVIQNSQRIPQFNAYGLYDMSMMSFVKVMKMAFSIYTVLRAISK